MEPLLALLFAFSSVPFIGNAINRKFLDKFFKVQISPHYSFNDGIIKNYRSDRTVEDYLDNKDIIPIFGSMWASLENTSGVGSIKIAPFVYLRLNARVKLPADTHFYVEPKDGIGGGGTPRYFYGVIDSETKNISCISYITSDFIDFETNSLPNRREFEYFSLSPGEFETFIINLEVEPGYYYNYDIGIPIKVNGKEIIKWSEDSFEIAIPLETTYVRPTNIEPWGDDPDLGQLPEDYKVSYTVPWLDQNKSVGHVVFVKNYNEQRSKVVKDLCRKYGKSEFKSFPESKRVLDYNEEIYKSVSSN